MPIVTRKSQLAFPEIARIRKGTKKQQKVSQNGRKYETFGLDLKDKFRIDWLPGNEKTQAAFGSDTVSHLVVTLAFNEIDMVWDNWFEAYTAGRMVARADGEKYIYLVDTETGEVIVRDGQPYKEFNKDVPVGQYKKSNGEVEYIYAKEHGRLRVVVPALRRMAYFTLVTTSATDCRLITEQLSALSDFAKRYHFQLAGVPLVLRRRAYQISYKEASGQSKRVEKYLVNIEADPEWVDRMTSHMKYMALPGDAPSLALPSGETLKGMPEDYNIAEPEEDDDVIEDIPDGEWVEVESTPVITVTPTLSTGTPTLSTGTPLMDLETANAVQNSEGKPYGEIDSDTLAYMAASLEKAIKKNPADDNLKYKRDAIKVILASRAQEGNG